MEDKILIESKLDHRVDKFLQACIYGLLSFAVVLLIFGLVKNVIDYYKQVSEWKEAWLRVWDGERVYTFDGGYGYYSVYDCLQAFCVSKSSYWHYKNIFSYIGFILEGDWLTLGIAIAVGVAIWLIVSKKNKYKIRGKLAVTGRVICIAVGIDTGIIFIGGLLSESWDLYIYLVMGFSLLILILYLIATRYRIVITENFVQGETWLGKQVNLPISQISVYSTRKFLSVVFVATKFGFVWFAFVDRYKEIGAVLRDLIQKRQEETKTAVVQGVATTVAEKGSPLQDLKTLKELLDCGALTQEEFDEQKKQILG